MARQLDQRAKHHSRRPCVIERSVRRGHVQVQLADQAGQAGRLAFRQVEDEPSQRGRIDDRMLERALETAPDEPRVERVVAVLNQHRALSEAQEPAPGVLELRRADEHRPIDVVALSRVRIDRRSAVHQRVEERQRAVEAESLGADLEDEKRRVARSFHVECDELGVVQGSLRTDLGSIDCDLVPRDRLGRPAGFEVQRLRRHQRASASARRAQAISSPLSARSSSTATA